MAGRMAHGGDGGDGGDGVRHGRNVFLAIYCHNLSYTSSTAQGGGKSFKNRKPIGEVGCCESGMAERSH